GGSSAPGFDRAAGAVRAAEMWDPVTERWRVMASAARYRGYHSNALLLPDGRVLVAGGGHPNPLDGPAEPNAEIFSPPYLFRGPRPAITSAPSAVVYRQTFEVRTPDAASIANVNWIRLSSVTHAFNQNQRINRLDFTATATGLLITAPLSPDLCPPGHYMLFILNGEGVPSVAEVVRIGSSIPPTPPTAAITSAVVSTAVGAANLRVTVRYADDQSLSWSSIDGGDVELRRAGGATTAAALVSRTLGPANVVTAVYSFAAPGGAWDSTDNGTYSVWQRPNEVWDNVGNPVATQNLNSYALWFNDPTAAVVSEVVENGGTYFDATVSYADVAGSPSGISWGSVSNGDVEFIGPRYSSEGTLRTRTTLPGGQLLATYRFPARDGYWDWTDNGAYSLRVRANQVWDLQGYTVAPLALRTYNLYFQTPHAAVISTTVAAGSTNMLIAIAYRANNRYMNWNSLSSGDVELSGPGGYVGASTLVSRTYSASNNTYTVVYRIPARNGTWDPTDNGTYMLRFRPNEVLDALGYPVPALTIQTYGLWF
ncbi:MAG: galactose oxidase-like domain-containing protein, partial [Phycisphaerales bacterium]